MKFQSNTLLPLLSKASVARLTKIVDETPDVVIVENKKSGMSAADLWKIHRQKRNFRERRFI